MIRLENVGPENWRLGLRVREDQRRYVSDSAGILARAYAYRESRSRAFVIYNDDVPIGMAMYYDLEDEYDFSQFFIDERYQGRGFGCTAAAMVLDEMKKDGAFGKVGLCYVEGNEAAMRMYLKLGFYHTGEADGDEIEMEKIL